MVCEDDKSTACIYIYIFGEQLYYVCISIKEERGNNAKDLGIKRKN